MKNEAVLTCIAIKIVDIMELGAIPISMGGIEREKAMIILEFLRKWYDEVKNSGSE